jgi:sugar phosphate isomerase/epimerase
LSALVDLAASDGFLLLHENEKEIVGDTPERCLALLNKVPALGFIWDPANFVQVGAEKQVDRWWDALGGRIRYVHIKDARLSDGGVVPGGQGDGQVRELLAKLYAAGYSGVLSLEPHLAIAGHSSGFSGVEGMTVAVNALRGLMAEVGFTES